MTARVSLWLHTALYATLSLLLLAGATPTVRAQRAPANSPKLDVPYEPTPHRVVDAMLRLGEVKLTDYVIELGCGDGRIAVAAAERYGARVLCVELDPERIKEARENARLAKVEDKVEIVQQNLFDTDLSKADVLTLYLWPEVNIKLRPRILDLKPGTRVVSHEHNMGDWRPDATRRVGANFMYMWRVPAKIAGNWRMMVDGQEIFLNLDQKYQALTGRSTGTRGTNAVRDGRIAGRDINFTLTLPNGRSRRFAGKLNDAGEIEGQGWKATRIEQG